MGSDRWVLTPRGERLAALLYGAGITVLAAGFFLFIAWVSYIVPD